MTYYSKKISRLRSTLKCVGDLLSQASDDIKDVAGVIGVVEERMVYDENVKTFNSTKRLVDLVDQVMAQGVKRCSKRSETGTVCTGVPTGYCTFDEYTGGLQSSDFIIIAGRPAMGKTAFALNVAMRASGVYSVPTAIFSLEMTKEQLMQRMLCSWGKVDFSRFRRGYLDDSDWAMLREAADALSSAPLFVDHTVALTTMELRSRCRRLKAEHGLGLVVVDYLQLMRSWGRHDSRELELSNISFNLKELAKELDVPVIALSQLSSKVEERGDKRPMISDLPDESSAIERDADVIIFLYREAAYKQKDELTPEDNVAEVIIGKQRNGPNGTVYLRFFKESASFENLQDIASPLGQEGASSGG